MKTWKWVVLALGIAGALGAATAAVAAGQGHRGQRFQKMISARIDHVLDEIDATPQQRQTINQAKDQLFANFQANAQARAQNRAHLVEVLTADKLDLQALNDEVDARANFAKQAIIPAIQTVHDALTPAQRQKVAELVKQHHGRMQGGFGGPDAP